MNPDRLPADLQDELAEISFREPAGPTRDQLYAELIARHPAHEQALRAAIRSEQSGLPDTIGPFRILTKLGEGGFGAVYEAQQTQGVDRIVALKVLRTGGDSRAVLARFELERQVLAAMSHDAIARFYEAGQADGQPWFSMELVAGRPLTDYCDEHRLSLRERIRLLLQVCEGVQHAHGKGIVHRDLKPANVLVSEQGAAHQAKIIDFGIARATDRKLSQSMQTMLGMVLGTPEYMAPEQCGGDPIHIDARTDVYALGVMLYELLTGRLPFAADELPRDNLLAVQKVLLQKEPPKPSTRITTLGVERDDLAGRRKVSTTAWSRAVRGDLDAIVGRAMEKEQDRRYQSVAEFAADLRRHLEHEPIVARPPSRAYRLKKFVRKYRGQVVAGVAILVTAIGGALVSANFARAEGKRAEENVKLANSLDGKVREFDQLAGVVLYERAIANEKELYPPWPHKVEAMEKWLREDAGKLLAMRPEIEKTVRDLEARALPSTAEELEADRRSHPRFAEFEAATKRVASLRYAQAIRVGSAQLVVKDLTAEQQGLDVNALNALAWERVAPPAKDGKAEERKVWGEEPLGLAAARAAAAKAKGTATEFQILDTLAWALVANGQDGPAKEASRHALDLAPEAEAAKYEQYLHDVQTASETAAEILASAEQQLAELTTAVSKRRRFRFALESQRFLRDTLAELLGKLGSLEAKEKAAVAQRLLWAKQIQQLTLAHPNAQHTWSAVRAAIAQNPKYAGQTIDLRDQEITSLVPIGENPVTHLWEFYELRSAWDGKGDPRAIAIPSHEPDGSIKVTGDTGIVFVLLPGGEFTMGAQRTDEDAPNFDRNARNDETPHRVSLSPFFLARHELTRGQWQRLTCIATFWHREGAKYEGDPFAIGATHPAELMDWVDANQWMIRHGLVLPTEAQWEYGCRGGMTTAYWCGPEPEDLDGCANVHDQTASRAHPEWGAAAPIADGFIAIAPVGSFQPNGFGLHDVHGNVREWCRDWYGAYDIESRSGDGYRLLETSSGRCSRGGTPSDSPLLTRSASRHRYEESVRYGNLGLRCARMIGADALQKESTVGGK